jgi:alanine racemase
MDDWKSCSHAAGGSLAGSLTVDLDAVVANWRLLAGRAPGAVCAAVVKADAYGLGALPVASSLAQAGCRHFFVAHLEEGVALRSVLDAQATIYVLHGVADAATGECAQLGIIPVLNSLAQIDAWARQAKALNLALPAMLQVDSGMSRLGLAPAEVAQLAASPARMAGIDLRCVMSHLACAEVGDHPANRLQLAAFGAARRHWPNARASFANSSGIFLGPDFHFDLLRPGAALYGVAPVEGKPNPMRPVVSLRGRVLQTRTVPAGTPVGYGWRWSAALEPTRLATIAVGYADGWLRSLTGRGHVYWHGHALPLVGTVSMDTVVIDASSLPDDALVDDPWVELLGREQGVDDAARAAGTIAYEILTSLGARYRRRYVGANSQKETS